MVHFGEFLKTWSLRSNSFTRQVSFNRIKIGGNAKIKKFKCDILSDFQTMWGFGIDNESCISKNCLFNFSCNWRILEKSGPYPCWNPSWRNQYVLDNPTNCDRKHPKSQNEKMSKLYYSFITHCSKSSFFVQKFNFDFPRKLLIFSGENSWKCCGFGLFSCWQLWFHEKNCQKNFGWKTRENVGV